MNRAAFVFFVALLGAPIAVLGAERILTYDAEIGIDADAVITVTETLTVQVEGEQIRRGIYRDFPTRYRDRFGNHYRVAFEVLGVDRNGAAESWHTENLANGVRIYAGHRDRLVPQGVHTYRIRYRTNRSVGFFDDHDELYWNVTGTGWVFPIDQVSAHVTLPARVPPERIHTEGYTGAFGSRDRNLQAVAETGGARFRTTRALSPGEGLTIVVGWPKGIVSEPGTLTRAGWLLQDNLGLLLSLAVLVAVCGFLYLAWRRHGKDPPAGVTFARYEPPEGFSPGAVRYIRNMGYDDQALAAAIVSLAVKGYLQIEQDEDGYVLHQRSSSEPLGPGEAELVRALFAEGPTVVLEDANHRLISRARRAHRAALKRHYYRRYFLNNSSWLVPTALGSVGAFVTLLAAGLVTPPVVAVFVLTGIIQGVFLVLMKAPTIPGRKLMDQLNGFELYLKVAEKDDLERRHPPELTPALFERYLPFAMALGVATEWAEQFAGILSRMGSDERTAYAPRWLF